MLGCFIDHLQECGGGGWSSLWDARFSCCFHWNIRKYILSLLYVAVVLKTRGGARNLPTEGLELPTRWLKWLKTQFTYVFAKFPPTGIQNFLRKGASPLLAPPLLGTRWHHVLSSYGSHRKFSWSCSLIVLFWYKKHEVKGASNNRAIYFKRFEAYIASQFPQ